MVTALYAGIFALMQVFLTLRVVQKRMFHQVSLGHGDNEDLMRHIRIHGNFVETIPMALFLMMLLESSGLDWWVIHALGGAMLLSRILHMVGLLTGDGRGHLRTAGVMLMILVYIVGAVLCFLMGQSVFNTGLPIQEG